MAYRFPQLFLQFCAGAATDRLASRQLYGLSESLLLLIAILLWLSSIGGNPSLWLWVAVCLGNGVISAFVASARSSLISVLLPNEVLVSAQQHLSVAAQGVGVFGVDCFW